MFSNRHLEIFLNFLKSITWMLSRYIFNPTMSTFSWVRKIKNLVRSYKMKIYIALSIAAVIIPKLWMQCSRNLVKKFKTVRTRNTGTIFFLLLRKNIFLLHHAEGKEGLSNYCLRWNLCSASFQECRSHSVMSLFEVIICQGYFFLRKPLDTDCAVLVNE